MAENLKINSDSEIEDALGVPIAQTGERMHLLQETRGMGYTITKRFVIKLLFNKIISYLY